MNHWYSKFLKELKLEVTELEIMNEAFVPCRRPMFGSDFTHADMHCKRVNVEV